MATAPDLTVDVSRPYLPTSGGSLAAELTIEPGRRRQPTARQVMVVLDTSGSMRGPKLQEAKRGAELVVEQLDEADHLALIAFDDTPETAIGPARRGELDRQVAGNRIAALEAGSGTDIHAALGQARAAFERFPDAEAASRRILLLSDGRDNYRDASAFAGLARSIDESGIRIEAAGLGTEYDEATIRTLAERARGRWRHIQEGGEVERFFGTAVTAMETVVGTDATLQFDCADGVDLAAVHRAAPQVQAAEVIYENGAAVVKLPDLMEGTAQRLTLEIEAPPGSRGETAILAELTLTAGDHTVSTALTVNYTTDAEKLSQGNTAVQLAHDEAIARAALARGATAVAAERTKLLEAKHGEAAAETVAELETERTLVERGDRAAKERATLVEDSSGAPST